MGCWGFGVYEGDSPMDAIVGMEHHIIGHSVCDNADGDEAEKDEVYVNRLKYDAGLVSPSKVNELFTIGDDTIDCDSHIWYQVLGAEVMRVGGPLGEHKATVLQAIDDDDWEHPERIKCMAEFKEMVEKYVDGTPSVIG